MLLLKPNEETNVVLEKRSQSVNNILASIQVPSSHNCVSTLGIGMGGGGVTEFITSQCLDSYISRGQF